MLKDLNAPEKVTKHQKNSLFDWLKFILIFSFSAVIIYKILTTTFNFNFAGFDFNALLALVLSIFAIALSVLFYFKASDTSNKFYDNSYRFTKDMSIMLGEMRERFGEKLENLGRSSTDMSRLLQDALSLQKNSQKKEKDIEELQSLFVELLAKAKFDNGEAEHLKSEFDKAVAELNKQQEEGDRINRSLIEELANESQRSLDKIDRFTQDILVGFIIHHDIQYDHLNRYPNIFLLNKYKIEKEKISKDEFAHLIKDKIIKSDGIFTLIGIQALKTITYFTG